MAILQCLKCQMVHVQARTSTRTSTFKETVAIPRIAKQPFPMDKHFFLRTICSEQDNLQNSAKNKTPPY